MTAGAKLTLTREWVACLSFDRGDREALVEVAAWLGREFGAVVTERYGGSQEWAKEYWWLRIAGAELLLLRKDGLSLGGDRRHNDLVVSIARAFGARFAGWRWRVWQLWRRLRGS